MIQAGPNIKAIRELRNLTQDYVASQLHMSIPNYSNIERGKTDITLGRLCQIARVLEIDYSQILQLNRATILNPSGIPEPAAGESSTRSCCQELARQLRIKDEQISRLLDLLQKKSC